VSGARRRDRPGEPHEDREEMLRRLIAPLIAALACGGLLAGCGGGKSGSSTQTSSAPAAGHTATTPSTSTGTGGIPPGATSPSGATGASAVGRAVESCRAAIAATPGLSPALKAKVEGICSKAAGGDIAGARKAAKEVCAEVVNALPGSAAEKQQARARCRNL
jgi:hypothetical protein